MVVPSIWTKIPTHKWISTDGQQSSLHPCVADHPQKEKEEGEEEKRDVELLMYSKK